MQFSNLSEIKERELIPGFHGRLIHSDSMTFVYWRIDEGAPLPEHSHPHVQYGWNRGCHHAGKTA